MEPKTWLLQMLAAVSSQQNAFLTARSGAELANLGTLQDWSRTSPKAIVSHNNMWNKKLLENCHLALRGLEPVPFSDGQQNNDRNYLEQANQSLENVLEDANHTLNAFVQLFQAAPDSQITTTNLYVGQTRPLWRMLPGTILVHPVLHYVIYEAAHGHLEKAAAISQRLFDLTQTMGGEDTRGVALYNLACCSAKIGCFDQAIRHLSSAISLMPHLLDVAKNDSHLSNLQRLPRFIALIADFES